MYNTQLTEKKKVLIYTLTLKNTQTVTQVMDVLSTLFERSGGFDMLVFYSAAAL